MLLQLPFSFRKKYLILTALLILNILKLQTKPRLLNQTCQFKKRPRKTTQFKAPKFPFQSLLIILNLSLISFKITPKFPLLKNT